VLGVEALMRWQHPERGLVPPARFIPLLEETGLILDVGRWALERAAADHVRFAAAGVRAPRIAVNVSSMQLARSDFVDTVIRALDHFDGAEGLDLEVTESMVMGDFQSATKKLNILRGLGIEIALDDFGTGYSSLGYVAKLPVNIIKIDRSFIVEMDSDDYCRNVVTMIIGLAHTLDLQVIAEGVDDLEQIHLLRKLGCNALQGYFIAKPLPFEELVIFLRDKERLATWRRQLN
jgi:EAL domain-containing protein (putative c-di-GMP-specific phosphodiesterase class I)